MCSSTSHKVICPQNRRNNLLSYGAHEVPPEYRGLDRSEKPCAPAASAAEAHLNTSMELSLLERHISFKTDRNSSPVAPPLQEVPPSMGGPRSQAQVERSGTRAQLEFGFHQQQIGNTIKPHRSLEPGCLQHVGNVPSGSSGGLSTNGPVYITQHVKWISIHSSNIYTYTEIENLNITEQHSMTNSGWVLVVWSNR